MKKEEIIKGLPNAILSLDANEITPIACLAIDQRVDILKAIDCSLTADIQEISRRFQDGQIYLPEP